MRMKREPRRHRVETKLAGLYLSETFYLKCLKMWLRVELKYQDALELLTCLRLHSRALRAEEAAV